MYQKGNQLYKYYHGQTSAGFVKFHYQKSSRFPQQRKFQSARGGGYNL